VRNGETKHRSGLEIGHPLICRAQLDWEDHIVDNLEGLYGYGTLSMGVSEG